MQRRIFHILSIHRKCTHRVLHGSARLVGEAESRIPNGLYLGEYLFVYNLAKSHQKFELKISFSFGDLSAKILLTGKN